MTYPPAAPGSPEGHDATQSFPAGGAPPPPPPSQPPPSPVPPGPAEVGPDPTAPVHPGAAPSYGGPHDTTSHGGYAPPGYGGYGTAPGYGAQGGAGAPAAPVAPAPRGGRGRVLGRALLVLVVIGALAGTTAWGFVNRSSAERWKERSEAADADLRESLERVETTNGELEDAQTRLRDLATEKAGETDRNRILSEIVAQAPEVTAALGDCQQATTALANDLIAAVSDPAAVVADLETRTDEVNAICATALDQAEQLETTIEALGI